MARYQKHGLLKNKQRHPLYRLWDIVKRRCLKASKHNFPYYQGKGIKICEDWLNPLNFYNWALNNGWKKGLSIDRIDSNKDYCPENCRFISLSENSKKARRENPYKYIKNRINYAAAKLNLDQVKEIRILLLQKIPGTQIAKKFNVQKKCIYNIKHNKTWKLEPSLNLHGANIS